jgi:hypothetical protein
MRASFRLTKKPQPAFVQIELDKKSSAVTQRSALKRK